MIEFVSIDESVDSLKDGFDALLYNVKKDYRGRDCDHHTGFKLQTVHRFPCEPMEAQAIVGDCREHDGGQAKEDEFDKSFTFRKNVIHPIYGEINS